jgi:hypothetical protein
MVRSASVDLNPVGLNPAGPVLRSARLYGRGDVAKKIGKGSAWNILFVNRVAGRLFHELFSGGLE